MKHSFKLIVVGNSFSVIKQAKKCINSTRPSYHCLYNFMGEDLMAHDFKTGEITIGAASMYAPWKGLHEIVIMAAMYNDELRELGVKKISLFGEMLYQTEGNHNNYYKELILLKNKLGADLVKFEGKKKPIQIYREVDILVHSSVTPEPFGRVLIEALISKIPVISTGLGGSAEVIEHHKTGMIYQKNDYASLYMSIKQLSENEIFRNRIIENGLIRYDKIQSTAQNQIEQILTEIGAELRPTKNQPKVAA